MKKFVFGMQIKSKVFYKMLLSSWVRVTRHAQSTQNKLVYLCIIYLQTIISFVLSRKVRHEVDFLHADKHQSFLQVDFNTLGFPARWYYYYWWAEPSILKSSKFTISLQYLKKEVKNGVYFLHVDKHQNFCKLALSSLTEVARHVQGTQNRKLVIFFQCIEKKVSQLLLCSTVMQTVQNFTEVQSFSLLLVFGWWSKIDAVF